MRDTLIFDAGLHVRLPAESFVSRAEFEAHRAAAEARLARQARIEAALASADPELHQSATCAPCLRPAMLTSRMTGGRLVEGSLRIPDWPAEQTCDCEDRLDGRDRALLQAAAASGGLRQWSRLLLLGPGGAVHRRLAAQAGETLRIADPGPGGALAAADGAADLIVAADCLHCAPALRPLLDELRRIAAPGGCLLARLPFRELAAGTTSRRPPGAGPGFAANELHAIGWDILAMLHDAGWAQAEMLLIWSRELGYLGPRNFLLRAAA